ncbi:efflux RND transporter periplasmic adaptor subunit [Shewanella sp. NIFS-20-20]|uniref:efflux RND transporter periplasmic adaptor subunit n=1 Tax=Shewanella sp. NIFS-20-20 TaxID=2853806 RepID=UPI001C495149|nr:efflux RND transporter periplasmic adaptor subunit [Shewanella sp. NIFS-20-20]MBV7316402.1 efflux RND transporter periplasmic adaptor subunit [Shewanella sp. NIFS-20-20]
MSIKTTIGALYIISVSLLLLGCQPPAPEAISKAATSVSSQPLVLSPGFQQQQRFTGSVRAANTTLIGFELAGRIEQLTVDSGDKVKQGQVLARLDTSLLEAMERELQAALAQNQVDIDLAKRTVSRSNELKNSQFIAEQQFDELQSRANKLLASKRQQTASLQRIQLQLNKSTLLAPFDAVVSDKSANLGQVVSQGTPLFTLIGHDQPMAYIGVPIDVAAKLTVGENLTLTVGEQVFAAELAGISAQVNPVSRTVELRFALPHNAKVYNGELAYLSYPSWTATPGFWVPIAALTDGIRGRWNVLTIVDNQGQSVIERRDVQILFSQADKAYISGAVHAGDIIVTQGLHKLVNGQAVIPTPMKG